MTKLAIQHLSKTYAGGFQALKCVNLEIRRGEIIALLGPNGAGKTTLISTICGLVNPSEGQVLVDGFDIIKDFRKTRSLIGLVPQELTTDAFESVLSTVTFSRGLFGKAPDAGHIEKVLRDLTLWEKRNNKIITLSGGMKRRVMIAKALSHEPMILFLDEPTVGIDAQSRNMILDSLASLNEQGTTMVYTTHYMEEAERLCKEVAIIDNGRIISQGEPGALVRDGGHENLQELFFSLTGRSLRD